jgi:hypothetical protein
MGWYQVRAAEAAKTRKQPTKPTSRSPKARPLTGASQSLSPSATHGSRRGSAFSVERSTVVEGDAGEGEGKDEGEGATVVGETGYDFAGLSVPTCFRADGEQPGVLSLSQTHFKSKGQSLCWQYGYHESREGRHFLSITVTVAPQHHDRYSLTP